MKLSRWLLFLSGLHLTFRPQPFEPFRVKDIRVDGIQRTEPGTVFRYLPVKVGDTLTEERRAEAVKSLYATGFFKDVRLGGRQAASWWFPWSERPAISQIEFVGEKEFDKEDAARRRSSRSGLAQGRIFDPQPAGESRAGVEDAVLSRGKYAVEITTTVTPLERNRVAINFTIAEGEVAKIRQINLVGNKGVSRATICSTCSCCAPRTAHLVQQERPVLQAEAGGRPGEPALQLPEPGLSRVHHRLDPGRHRAGQEGHLHQREPHRGREVHRHG